MQELRISSIPLIDLTQEAYESLVTQLTVQIGATHGVFERAHLQVKREKAQMMIDTIREISLNARTDV